MKNFFLHNNNYDIAYHKISSIPNDKPGLIFLSGFNSDMSGTKAQSILNFAQNTGYDYICFDYFGTGKSSGKFEDGTIGMWLENSLAIIDQLTNKPQIIIGSSMGGWIMLLAALLRPNKICGLIGIAAAPDFTEELIWDCMTAQQKEAIVKEKVISFSNEFCDEPYPISYNLITEAREHLLLKQDINLDIPIRLIHGTNDKDVPYSTALRLIEKITSNDAQLHLLKNSGHRLSAPDELKFIYQEINNLSQRIMTK